MGLFLVRIPKCLQEKVNHLFMKNSLFELLEKLESYNCDGVLIRYFAFAASALVSGTFKMKHIIIIVLFIVLSLFKMMDDVSFFYMFNYYISF